MPWPTARLDVLPSELQRLLDSPDDTAQEAAWDAFIARHSRLLLHIARSVMPDGDDAMDAYTHVLGRLRRDNFRALGIYEANAESKFTTWLAVVTRRMCVDYYRQRYGRRRGDAKSERVEAERVARRRLTHFIPSPVQLTQIVDCRNVGPERELRDTELHEALDAAIASLDPDDQLLVKLRFEDGLSAQAIASIVSMPSAFHVYRRLKVVCAELRRQLGTRGIEGSTP